MARQDSPVAFVLSGGAGLGAIQVGMLHALCERGIEPYLILATSGGAINGACIATRPQTVETVDALAEIWRHVRRGQVFPSTGSAVCSASWAAVPTSSRPPACAGA